jgi:hypothetical protein
LQKEIKNDQIHMQKENKQTSQYVGVYYNKKNKLNPWIVKLSIDGKKIYFGSFDAEIKAAKHANAMCKKYGKSTQNLEFSSDDEIQEKLKQKTSQYVGVSYFKRSKLNPWMACLTIDGKKKYLGCFDTELKAANQINAIRKNYGLPEKKLNASLKYETLERKQKSPQKTELKIYKLKQENEIQTKKENEEKIEDFNFQNKRPQTKKHSIKRKRENNEEEVDLSEYKKIRGIDDTETEIMSKSYLESLSIVHNILNDHNQNDAQENIFKTNTQYLMLD